MSNTVLDRYTIGAGKFLPVDHTGPASYTSGGETLGTTNNMTGISLLGLGSIDFVDAEVFSLSGNYQVFEQATGLGSRKTFLLRWFYAPAQHGVIAAVVALGTSPTNGTYTITAGSGAAQIQVVVASGALSSVKILNPGNNYLSVPTFTPPAGLGSGATITASIGYVSDVEVAAGTNLSGETARLAFIGR